MEGPALRRGHKFTLIVWRHLARKLKFLDEGNGGVIF
jgi:hypothetical protein